MIEDHWIDLACYSILFVNREGKAFTRDVAVPLNFPEEEIETFFYQHFKVNDVKVIDVNEMSELWLSKHTHAPFMEFSN